MAASMCSEFVSSYVNSLDKNIVVNLSKEIEEGTTKLLDLVHALEPYLTSTDNTQRCNGTSLLTQLLHCIKKNVLNEKEIGVLVTFLCDRIKDHHSVQPHVLSGMYALCEFSSLPADGIHSLLRNINKELHIQSLTQKDRRNYYNMILYLLSHRLQACQQMEGDFVYCYMQAMDGEKDPRNLVLGFKCVLIIAQQLPLGVFVEELFEVVACYFPIDFSPPPNDPFGIKKEELVLGLRECLSSTPKFAEFCLPLLLEKATSSVQSAKVDALETLKMCTPVYGALKLKEYISSFWSAIQREVISGLSSSVETAALDALTAITRTLSTQFKTGHTAELHNFIKEAFNDSQRHLREPDGRLAHSSAKLLETIAKSTEDACVGTVNLVIPLCLELFHKHSQANPRRVILDITINFIKLVKQLDFNSDKNPLSAYKSTLYTILVSMVMDLTSQLRCLGIAGLVGLLGIPDMLSAEELVNVAEHLLQVVMKDADSLVRKEAISALTYMSLEYPAIIRQHVLDILLNAVNHEPMDTESCDNTTPPATHLTPEFLLSSIANLSTTCDLVKYTTPMYTEHIDKLHDKYKKESSEEILIEAQTTCKCLTEIVKNNINNSSCVDYFYTDLLLKCFHLASKGVTDSCENSSSLLSSTDLVALLATVIRIITCHLSVDQSKSLAENTVQLFTEKESSWLNITAPFSIKKDSPLKDKQGMPLLSAVIGSLPQQVSIPNYSDVLQQLSQLCIDQSETSLHCDEAAKCLAALYNKYGIDGKLEDSTSPLGQLYSIYKNTDTDLCTRQKAFTALLWSTKATVLASHTLQYQLTDMVIQALKQPEFARLAADGFYIILNEYEDVMSVEMHAVVKIMYRQRFFHMTMPKLLEGFHIAANDGKPYYLTALSYLLRFVPKQVLMAELPPVIPLLIQSLLLPDEPQLWMSTINTVYDLIHDAVDTFHSHVNDLLPKLLNLAQYKPNMKVRISSVHCIGLLSTFPPHLILPHKKPVLRALGSCLDDHKRLVRKEVATARAEWFLLGEPGSKQ